MAQITGQRFLYDLQRLYGTYSIMSYVTNDNGAPRTFEGVTGCCFMAHNEQNVRAIGRGLTELVYAWLITRDDEAGAIDKEYFRIRVEKNLRLGDASAVPDPVNNPMKWVWNGLGQSYTCCPWVSSGYAAGSKGQGGLWQQTYVMFAVHKAMEMGDFGTNGTAFRSGALYFLIQLMKSQPGAGSVYPREFAFPYDFGGGWHFPAGTQTFTPITSLADMNLHHMQYYFGTGSTVSQAKIDEIYPHKGLLSPGGYALEFRAMVRLGCVTGDLTPTECNNLTIWIDDHTFAGFGSVTVKAQSRDLGGFDWDAVPP